MFRDVYYITVDGPSCERARKLFNLHGLPIGCVLLNEKNIFQQAQTLMEQGAKIFIARGGVAAIVKRLVPVLVVPLSYDFIDFYYPVMEACSRSEKVVVVGWYQHILWFEEYKKLLPSKVRYVDPPNFQSPNTEELWEVVRQLKEEGFEYFVGGSVVENEAIRLGAQGLQVNVSDEAYLQAAREALHYTHILKERELWYHTAEVILEHAGRSGSPILRHRHGGWQGYLCAKGRGTYNFSPPQNWVCISELQPGAGAECLRKYCAADTA